MRCRVKLFARARDLAGTPEAALDVPDGTTVGDLRRLLAQVYPALGTLLGRCAVAVQEEFADDALPLREGDEIAILPPVSGGSPTIQLNQDARKNRRM